MLLFFTNCAGDLLKRLSGKSEPGAELGALVPYAYTTGGAILGAVEGFGRSLGHSATDLNQRIGVTLTTMGTDAVIVAATTWVATALLIFALNDIPNRRKQFSTRRQERKQTL